ncbi:MAG: hypothetical protein BHV89_21285 [Clostridiales bacterium 41_21_two_genomes]|nr:MAG: hypothetical protein BHV89_21285 [Clostridiales bacterium 41_21_two_genomes]
MRKSFKKVVACLLAVLMVTFSVPFTALATPDDYKPNFTLQFNTFVADDSFDAEGITSTKWGMKTPAYDLYSGVHGAPLDYEGGVNKEDGSLEITRLYLENSKVQGILDYNGLTADDYAGEVTGQTNYVKGMPFTITVKLNNIHELTAFELKNTYSDNIAPAIVYKAGARANTATAKIASIADYKADTAKSKTPVTNEKSVYQTAGNYYEGMSEGNNSNASFTASSGAVYSYATLSGDGRESQDFTSVNTNVDNGGDDGITNPKTGATGYDCANDAILVTFLFIVTGEVSEQHPIKIGLYQDKHSGASCAQNMSGLDDINLASYGQKVEGQVGAYHCYFMGYNALTKQSLGAAQHTHTAGEPKQENVVPATCTTDGSYDEVVRCTEDNEIISTKHHVIPATGHKFVDTVVAPTCTAQGYTLHKCSVCGEETKDTYTDALGHEYGEWVIDKPATEDTEGSKHRDCIRGDDTQTAVIPQLTHVHTPAAAVKENEVPATCEAEGSYDEVVRCSKCGEVITTTHKTTPALGHKWKATKVVAPTYESQGYTEYVCENDPSHTKKDDYTAKLDGVKLTVNGKYSSYGSVEGYDFDKATWAGKNSTVTLKASPIEGAVFAGWEIDGKVVSTAETLELTMYKDITVTPIFQEEQKSTITVVFLDMYNNVTASYTNMTAAEFQAEMAKAIPTPAEYPGYTFAGWSQTDDAIKALDTSATITSSYKTRGNSYTVNAQGANITVNGETKADTFADIAYDTAVTVSADNAKAWAIDGTTVAVGSSYTFYVGSDVTITPVTDAVTDKPMTAIVSAAPATAGSYRVSFLASSYIPAGYTVIDRGFVYGKGATQDELTLEKVGTTIAATGAKVKSISVPTNKDTVNDFGLVYGVKNKDAAATAVAYVTVKSMADDSVTTVYSTISQFNY